MVANIRAASIEDLDAIPDDGRVYELLNGVISMAAAPTYRHQIACRTIFRLIDAWVAERGIGETLFAPVDVVLDCYDVVQPDIVYIDSTHLTTVRDGRIFGPPQLIVEVISPTSRSRDSVEKAIRYAIAGATEYWLVDPQLEAIAVFSLIESVYVERAGDDKGIVASVVLPGLEIDPTAIFATVNESIRRTYGPSPGD